MEIIALTPVAKATLGAISPAALYSYEFVTRTQLTRVPIMLLLFHCASVPTSRCLGDEICDEVNLQCLEIFLFLPSNSLGL